MSRPFDPPSLPMKSSALRIAASAGRAIPATADLHELMDARRLHAVFQPILDFRRRQFLGFEGLIRGPADSPLHTPAALFEAARQANLLPALERLAREVVLSDFARLGASGRLFINVSVGCLGEPALIADDLPTLLERLDLRADRIVIEITENQRVQDFSVFRETLAAYRRLGFRFAIDDLGEGFSNLRMWSEIRPEYVKIDRHFVSGVSDDALKFQLVRAMHEIAETCHATIIAEGIEAEADFTTLRDLGICCGQGYLIARPEVRPEAQPTANVLGLLERRRIVVFPQETSPGAAAPRVSQLLRRVEPVAPSQSNDEVYARFEAEPEAHVLPVVADGLPLGMINRYTLVDRFARPYRRELYGRKPCTQLMDAAPLVVPHDASVQEVGLLLGNTARHHLFDGFIITEGGRYVGIGSGQDLLALITELQIRSARYANPLTQLPGNVPINEHVDRLLESGVPFVACYADIDHFKPYNDAYGYRRGDEVIRSLGAILSRRVDARHDFVGHIGGDDFVMLMQSIDWEGRCATALKDFDQAVAELADAEDLALGGFAGEDRRGRRTFHPLPSLSIGCVVVEAQTFSSHAEVSAAVSEAKKQAKKLPGSALFLERRRYGPALQKAAEAAEATV